ncbi:hypothetical protein GA0115253_109029 [Streptomyces sp. Termitarium-T10T-6]|nr:hypothetical protein [Streptomyces sp. Termitarium-T10T-6]SCE61080.1 hypothetical protein GA0115253_109029 [Streptomyces sp. Termitarium-T10T-6]
MMDDRTADEAPLPVVKREEITPAIAARILDATRMHGCNPRKLDPAHASRLARDMSSGGWNDHNPDVLSLCSHGAALQGQHRLEALIISQITRNFLIARDVPHATATTMDCGKARSAATALSLAGVQTGRKDIASSVRLLQLYDTERTKTPWPMWRSVTYTNAEIVRLFTSAYPDLAQYQPQMSALKSGLHSAPAASLTCSYLIHRNSQDPAMTADFLQGLVSGAHLDESDPRWVLRRWFVKPNRPRRGSSVSPLQLGMIIKCWNLWAAGATWEVAYFRPNERMPDVLSVREARNTLGPLAASSSGKPPRRLQRAAANLVPLPDQRTPAQARLPLTADLATA